MKDNESIVVYQWRAWDGFLISRLIPDATVVAAAFDHSLQDVLQALPPWPSAFLPHLACSLTAHFPTCREGLMLELASRSIRLPNRDVVDISKKALQRCCVEASLPATLAGKEGDQAELLIVKTNSNFGGKNELTLSEANRAALGIREHNKEVIKGPYQYIVRTRGEIPSCWWSDDNLILERYIENDEHIYYRCWAAGDHLVLIEMFNPDRIKKMGKSRLLRHWMIKLREGGSADISGSDCPRSMVGDIECFKKGFCLDFGSVDIVINQGGVPYIIDVNSTPYYNTQLEVPGMIDHLASGLCG
jgi:hypothetical protein